MHTLQILWEGHKIQCGPEKPLKTVTATESELLLHV